MRRINKNQHTCNCITSTFYWILDISFSPPQSLALLGLGLLEVNFMQSPTWPFAFFLTLVFYWIWNKLPKENVVDWTSKFKGLKHFNRYRICKKTNGKNEHEQHTMSLSSLFIECSFAFFANGPTYLRATKNCLEDHMWPADHRVAHPCSKSIGNLRFRQRPNTIAYITDRLSFSTVLWQLRPRYISQVLF